MTFIIIFRFSVDVYLQFLFLPHFSLQQHVPYVDQYPLNTGRKLNIHTTSLRSFESRMYVQFTSCFQGLGPRSPSSSSNGFFYLQDIYFVYQPQISNSCFHDANLASKEIRVFFVLPWGYGKKLFVRYKCAWIFWLPTSLIIQLLLLRKRFPRSWIHVGSELKSE